MVFPIKDKARDCDWIAQCIDTLSEKNIIIRFSNRKSFLNGLNWPILLVNDDALSLLLFNYDVGQRLLLNGLGSSFVSGHIHL